MPRTRTPDSLYAVTLTVLDDGATLTLTTRPGEASEQAVTVLLRHAADDDGALVQAVGAALALLTHLA